MFKIRPKHLEGTLFDVGNTRMDQSVSFCHALPEYAVLFHEPLHYDVLLIRFALPAQVLVLDAFEPYLESLLLIFVEFHLKAFFYQLVVVEGPLVVREVIAPDLLRVSAAVDPRSAACEGFVAAARQFVRGA